MIPRLLAAAFTLAAVLPAQSPLSTIPTPIPSNWYLWLGCANPNVFFNLTVNTTITIQGLDVSLDNQIGAQGSIDVYVTNPGITTHVGNETQINNWTLRASGPVTSAGTMSPARVSLSQGIVLNPGNYGIAVRYNGVRAEFVLGTGSNQVFTNNELTLSAGATQSGAFTTGVSSPYVWQGRIHYLLGNAPHAAAANTSYGTGCNTVNGSFYQRFTCTGPAAQALSGRAITLTPTANGYSVAPSTGIVFNPPTATAGSLPPNDDGETMVALTTPFPYPGGTAQQFWVHTNGYVSVASNALIYPNSWTPFVPGLLNAPVTAWYSWHDYNPTESGSGTIKFEELAGVVYITWDDVESYPIVNGTTPVVNRSKWQFQFETATGRVHYVWQTITPTGGSNEGDEHVIGFSPGGQSPDTGAIDIASLAPTPLVVPEKLPLALSASPAPLLGNTVVYTTGNESSQGVGLFFLCASQLPALSLAPIGMPNCAAHVDIATGVGNVIGNFGGGLSMTASLPIPALPTLLGADLFGQSIWLDPAANPFGAIASNGVRTRIGNF